MALFQNWKSSLELISKNINSRDGIMVDKKGMDSVEEKKEVTEKEKDIEENHEEEMIRPDKKNKEKRKESSKGAWKDKKFKKKVAIVLNRMKESEIELARKPKKEIKKSAEVPKLVVSLLLCATCIKQRER